MKSMHNGVTGPCKHGGEGPLEVMACQDTNEFYGSSSRPLIVELCRVGSHMKMSFRDTWSLSVQDDRVIVGHGKRMIKRLNKDLGSKFSMKALGPTQQILRIKIIGDRRNKKFSYYLGVILHSEQVQL